MKVRKNEDQWHGLVAIFAGIELQAKRIAFESNENKRIMMCKKINESLMEAEKSVRKICQECQKEWNDGSST